MPPQRLSMCRDQSTSEQALHKFLKKQLKWAQLVALRGNRCSSILADGEATLYSMVGGTCYFILFSLSVEGGKRVGELPDPGFRFKTSLAIVELVCHHGTPGHVLPLGSWTSQISVLDPSLLSMIPSKAEYLNNDINIIIFRWLVLLVEKKINISEYLYFYDICPLN